MKTRPSSAIRRSPLIYSTLLAALACGPRGGTRELDRADAIPVSALSDLHARLRAESSALDASGAESAVAAASDGSAVVGVVLGTAAPARPWQHAAKVSAGLALDRHVVVYGDDARFTALDAESGRPRWSVPRARAELIAVSHVAGQTALLLRDPRTNDRWISSVDGAGAERWRISAPAELGVPAPFQRFLLVPWGGSFVSAFDVADGSERGRARLTTPVSHAAVIDGEVIFGGPPFTALDGTPSSPWELPRRPLPGRVVYAPGPAFAAGDAVTAVYARAPAADGAGSGPYLATFGRLALGLDGASGALLWVEVLPGAVLGAAVLERGFAACEASGSVHMLSPESGATGAALRLRRPPRGLLPEQALQSCALHGGKIGSALAGKAGKAGAPGNSLVQQLSRALALPDPELAEAQRFLSRELAIRPEPEATRALIDLAMRRSADRVLQAEAEDLLATRRNGVELMLEALAAPPPGVDPIALPPLGALADALLALEERRAAPLLAAQLNRPGHAPQALARAAAALERLATPAEYPELRVFFSLHRASADTPDGVRAAGAVGRTLLAVGGEEGRSVVEIAARDPLTDAEVRAELTRALQAAHPLPP